MITKKYFNTESNIILVGKTAKAGGTSLLEAMYLIASVNLTPVVEVYFENSSSILNAIDYLERKLDTWSKAVSTSEEILVLLDEVGILTDEQRTLLLVLIKKWAEVGNIKFICVGSESALGSMFENILEAKYFNLSKYDSSGFLLTNTFGATVTIGSCISSGIFPPEGISLEPTIEARLDPELDYHTHQASIIYSIPYDELIEERRRNAKHTDPLGEPVCCKSSEYTIVDKEVFVSLLKRAIDGRTINGFCTGSYGLSSTHILKLLTMCIEVTSHSTLEGIVEKAGGRVTLDELLSTLKPFTFYTNN